MGKARNLVIQIAVRHWQNHLGSKFLGAIQGL